MSIMRLGYVHARVTDLDEAARHYGGTLGMTEVAKSSGARYFKAWDEWDHHSVVIEEGGVGLVKLGYKCSKEDDLDRYEKSLSNFGVAVSRMSKGDNLAVGDGIRFTAPSGHVFELYHEIEYVGTDTGSINPDPWPRDQRGAAVHRLDHALVTAEDVDLMERMLIECLGWRPSERVVESASNPALIGTWMFCGQTVHDLAIIKGENGKLHHFAFLLDDWSEVLKAGDVLAMNDVPVDFGPTRHGITRGKTIYFFDPSGNRNEVFAGGYVTSEDFPTITWTTDQLGKGIFYVQRELNDRFLTVFT